jgi:metal-responsive CopG/Arc/MetJ family transcriptional regulator
MEKNEFGLYPKRYLVNRRRSLSIPDKLWDDMVKATKETCSVSEFVRQAIKEKIEKFPNALLNKTNNDYE